MQVDGPPGMGDDHDHQPWRRDETLGSGSKRPASDAGPGNDRSSGTQVHPIVGCTDWGEVRQNVHMVFIHPTADIEPDVTIGHGTKIWRLTHIRSTASLGADCNVGRNVFVDVGVSVGARCKIQNNVSVYEGVTLEDDVFVGPSAVFTNDQTPRAFGDWEVVPTLVRRGASIGGGAVIVCGVVIGEYAMVGAGAVVTRDVEAYRLVLGNPARPVGWVCRCGKVVSRSNSRPEPLECETCRTSDLGDNGQGDGAT